MGSLRPKQQGQVGVATIFSLLLASGMIAWTSAALYARSDDGGAKAAEVVGTSAEGAAQADPSDLLNPENAPPFDGPKHETYDASMPPPMKGTEHEVTLKVTEKEFEVAEGKFMNLWTFGGTVPGPVIHVTQGDLIHFKITNNGTMSHSIDFHAAEIAPNRAYVEVQAGDSFTFDFVATKPGVFMYHCATAPVLHHIGNGMYGMLVVDPKDDPLPPAREYALVQSELYFGGQGEISDINKLLAATPDWIVFNGAANQYVDDPLIADPAERVRVYILNAGPSKWSAFHVIGAIFDRTWQEGVVGGPAQTVSIAPSQGAIVDFSMEEDGMYPFVTHAFADAVKGAIGIFMVGDGGPASGHGS